MSPVSKRFVQLKCDRYISSRTSSQRLLVSKTARQGELVFFGLIGNRGVSNAPSLFSIECFTPFTHLVFNVTKTQKGKWKIIF